MVAMRRRWGTFAEFGRRTANTAVLLASGPKPNRSGELTKKTLFEESRNTNLGSDEARGKEHLCEIFDFYIMLLIAVEINPMLGLKA